MPTLAKVSQYQRDRRSHRPDSAKPKQCYRCGKDRHTDMMACKALDRVCLLCNKKGHFASVCRSAPRIRSKKVNLRPTNQKVHLLITDVYLNSAQSRPAPKVWVHTTHPAGSEEVKWTPDSEAEATVLGLCVAGSLGIRPDMQQTTSGMNLWAAGQHPLTCLGTFSANL
ncbi:hypothetical protein Hamer_G003233 [Homarus americanus]|uniref:CCHC-type domain-containing protein n=1 Tax=Homarus americanus TaxID=6706 RepID=A0A8J5N6Y5_HOMAM|nr:hypothetical protein Hamer_G003233 [Homarus americanus]